jgi:uncharacterized repeat protein (TIGR03847 family)
MNYEFSSPSRIMVGTRGEVGNRLFLVQVREGRRLIIVKFEKLQLAAIAEWIGSAIKQFTRPGHLPDDYQLEPEYEVDLVAGEIGMGVDEDLERIEIEITSVDEDDVVDISLSKEQAGGFAIAITRLIEAGRPPCPLCSLPLDPRGHDCPRTNGYRAPIR